MLTPPPPPPDVDCGVEGLLDSVVLALVALFEALELAAAGPAGPGVDGGVLAGTWCCWCSFWRMVDEIDSLIEAADETRSVVLASLPV